MRQSTSISYFKPRTIENHFLIVLAHTCLPPPPPICYPLLPVALFVYSSISFYFLFAYSFDFVFGHSSTNNEILLKIYEKMFAKRRNLYPSQTNKQTTKIATENDKNQKKTRWNERTTKQIVPKPKSSCKCNYRIDI